MTWINDAVQALKKIILVEEKLTTITGDIKELTERLYEIDKRLIKIEIKFEVYESLSRKTLPKA